MTSTQLAQERRYTAWRTWCANEPAFDAWIFCGGARALFQLVMGALFGARRKERVEAERARESG